MSILTSLQDLKQYEKDKKIVPVAKDIKSITKKNNNEY